MRIGFAVLAFWWGMGVMPVALAADHEAWYRVDSPHFTLYTDKSPEDAREKARRLELFRELALMVTNSQAANEGPPLAIYLTSTLSQFKALSGLDSNYYAGANFARWGGDRMSVVRDFGDEDFNQSVLLGTYVVDLLRSNSGVRYPAWYVYGFSEYLSQVKFTDKMISYGLPAEVRLDQLRGQTIRPGLSWQSFDVLMSRDDRPDNAQLSSYDAQSWLATHFFMSDEARKKILIDYLNQFNQTGNAGEAYNDTIGKRYVNFFQEMVRYFAKGRYVTGNIEITGAAEYDISVTALDPADRLLVMGSAYSVNRNADACVLAFNERIALLPGDADSLAGIAYCKAGEGDFSAIANATLPDHASDTARLWLASAYMLQAKALKRAGKADTPVVDAAYAQVAAVLKNNKRSAKAVAIAAWVMEERANYEMAAKLYETASVYVPYDMEMVLAEASMLAKTGDLDRARLLFERYQIYSSESDRSAAAYRALQAQLYPDAKDEGQE
ncbi:MAG TPA: hypothetical protein VIM96_02895 [Pseudomonadales bacterium]